MPRRLIVPEIRPGPNILPQDQAHHARDVLRLRVGDEVELFTAAGDTASGAIVEATPLRVVVNVARLNASSTDRFELTIASAVPKGARADWMIEKLSELGVARFIPLITARSVVHPEGKNKLERWRRLAEESAKQSKRTGVMTIDPPAPLTNALDQIAHAAAYLSTAADALPPSSILHPPSSSFILLVGPEGGWSDDEIRLFETRHLTAITMGGTILRVETAAIAAAAVVAALRTEKHHSSSQRSSHSP
jgi:16S rRNA (uracil1498-N3)-methyltransferase